MVYRYKISNWHQLSKCKSNNSACLHITVSDFVNTDRLQGTRISVIDKQLGNLFTCLVGATGSVVRPADGSQRFELTTDQILFALNTFGFYIEYNPETSLSGDQLTYLMTLRNLHYDKLRIMAVWDSKTGIKEFTTYIVGFNSENNGNWLNSGYSPSIQEFTEALNNGSAINITYISETQGYRWDWLYNWVASIDDILNGLLPTQGATP